MSCHLYKDAILDLARSAAIAPDMAEAVRSHLDGCATCAADLRRQRDLTAALAELAGDARAWKASSDVENRLLQRFAVAHEEVPVRSSRGTRWAMGIGVAASVALMAWGSWPVRPVRVPEVPPAAPVVAVPSIANVPEPAATSLSPPAVSQPAHAPRRVTRRAPSASARPVEFMWIPGATALPTLESASIVRVELPVSALPAYGVHIVPDAVGSSVEADVLVGQDGQARGIRLISSATEGAQRSQQ
jgi:hypothetical protein